jgi:ribulose-phosphate 3-epimerase
MGTGSETSPRVWIAPSILASDFLRLGDEVRAVREAGAQRIQIDVMDGRFVPNITLGPAVVSAIRQTTDMMLEAHLMIVEPEKYVSAFAEAGADYIIVHQEASPHLYRTLEQIHSLGKRAGVAINPATPWIVLEEVLALADLILVMTVNPGFGGQEFIASMLPKIRRVRSELDARSLPAELEVDGGIDLETAPLAAEAGARVLVAGTSVYRAPEGIARAMTRLQSAAERGMRREPMP